MIAMIIDFEATDATSEAQATEIGHMAVMFSDKGLVKDGNVGVRSELCKPDTAITFGSMAITHITPDDVASKASHKDVCNRILPKGEAYIIGHNIDFDIQVAANAGIDVSKYKAICTLALARYTWPESETHKLGALSYEHDYKFAREHAKNAHNAATDVTMCARLLHKICSIHGINDMQKLFELSEYARVPITLNFGKHKGTAISEVVKTDNSYLDWLYNATDDKYLQIAINRARA